MIKNWIGRILGSNGRRTSEALLDRMGLDEATHLGAIVDSVDRLGSELSRARRYEHAFSIAVLSASPMTSSSEGSGNGSRSAHRQGPTEKTPTIETEVPQVISLLAAAALRELLRESDVVCYHASEDRFVLGLAESDGDAARQALRRVREMLRTRLNMRARVGVARFPEDGLTLDDLVAEARRRSMGSWADELRRLPTGKPKPRRTAAHSPEQLTDTVPGNGS